MCGILGEVSLSGVKNNSEGIIQNLLKRIEHRGPDYGSVFADRNTTLGHRRLSILDLSSHGNQPMVDPITGNVIVYNGEIYNFLELKRSLEKQGIQFKTSCDTEVLLYLYRVKGAECLHDLRGMFSFVIWNPKDRIFLMARDRIGKKPLVYHRQGDRILFSSEIDALAHHPEIGLDIDMKAVDLYFSLQAIPAPLTVYKEIKKLPPGHFAVLSSDGFEVKRYWSLDYTKKKLYASHEDLLNEARDILTESVKLRTVSDVPIGALLSGGVDSSLVVGLLQKVSTKKVKTFSIGFGDPKYNELPYAKIVADHLGTDHTEMCLTPNIAMDMIPKLAPHYGEPYADSSALPTLCVSELTRKSIKVALTGDGGDELCSGYDHYRQRPLATIIHKLFGLKKINLKMCEELSLKKNLFDKNLFSLIQRYLFPEARSLFYGAYFQGSSRRLLLNGFEGVETIKWKQDLLEKSFEHAKNPIERLLWMDQQFYLPDDLMVKVDIASMAYGLELRSPLLDHKVVEYFASIPIDYKIKRKNTKILLKKLAAELVPREVLYRPKKGFSIPAWIRGPLYKPMEELVQDTREALGNILNVDYVTKMMENHLESGSHENRLWSVFVFSHWLNHRNSILKNRMTMSPK